MKVAYRYDQCDIYFGGRLQKYTGSPTEGTVKLLTAVKGRGVYKDVNEVSPCPSFEQRCRLMLNLRENRFISSPTPSSRV